MFNSKQTCNQSFTTCQVLNSQTCNPNSKIPFICVLREFKFSEFPTSLQNMRKEFSAKFGDWGKGLLHGKSMVGSHKKGKYFVNICAVACRLKNVILLVS